MLLNEASWKREFPTSRVSGLSVVGNWQSSALSENYYLLTRLSELLEENKERSRIWKQKMEFETQKKMENYYLLTLFPGLLEQKKERSGGKVGLKSIKLLPADPLNLPGLLEQKKGKKQRQGGLKSISKICNTGLFSWQNL